MKRKYNRFNFYLFALGVLIFCTLVVYMYNPSYITRSEAYNTSSEIQEEILLNKQTASIEKNRFKRAYESNWDDAAGHSFDEHEDRDTSKLILAVPKSLLSKHTLHTFTQLLNFLESDTGYPIALRQVDSYASLMEQYHAGAIDFAFSGRLSAALIEKEGTRPIPIASPIPIEERSYHALIVADQQLDENIFFELEGKAFAFTDPLSATGHFYPMHLINQYQLPVPEKFFSHHFYTYCPKDAILSVLSGVTAAASTNSITFDRLKEDRPEAVDELQVMHTSTPMDPPVLIASPHVSSQITEDWKTFFQRVHQDEKGETILESLGWERLITGEAIDYKPLEHYGEVLDNEF